MQRSQACAACLQLVRVQNPLAADVDNVKQLGRELQALFRRHGRSNLGNGM